MKNEMTGACIGKTIGANMVLVGKPEGKRPLGRPRCRWEDNIKMDLQVMGRRGTDCIELAKNRAGGGIL
jgi:hypothetical protein